MTDIERLAVAQALFKVLADVVSTKDPDSLRSKVDADMVATYEETGAKTFDLRLNGAVVGTYTVCVSKEAHRTDVVVDDDEAFLAWCLENGHAKNVTTYDVQMPDDPADDVSDAVALLLREGVIQEHTTTKLCPRALTKAQEVGEVPGGCKVVVVDEPAEPTGTMLRVDPLLVARAMGEELPGAVAGLIAEGGDAA